MDFIKLTDTGLKIATRQEIYEQFKVFARAAYGEDISIDEGTPFDVFLGMLADGVSTVNGAAQDLSEMFSVKELSGNFLDFVAGQRGIVRKVKKNQRVTMTVTLPSNGTIERPFLASAGSIVVKDILGRSWVNTTQLMVHQYKFEVNGNFSTASNFQGTCEFGLLENGLNGYDGTLLYVNNMVAGATQEQLQSSRRDTLEIISPAVLVPSVENEKGDATVRTLIVNKVNATPAVLETETDAQLRARYDTAVYANSPSTIEGLRSNLLKLVNYVKIVENHSGKDDANGIPSFSIWVIVDGGSTAGIDTTNSGSMDDSSDPLDVAIAQTILNYKSLGCGVSVSNSVPVGQKVMIDGEELNVGNVGVFIPVDTTTALIQFTRLIPNNVSFRISLKVLKPADGVMQNTVRERVSYELQQYVARLQPGDVITAVGVISTIQKVLVQYGEGRFDFDASTPLTHINVSSVTSSSKNVVIYQFGTGIEIYQRAKGGSATVEFTTADDLIL